VLLRQVPPTATQPPRASLLVLEEPVGPRRDALRGLASKLDKTRSFCPHARRFRRLEELFLLEEAGVLTTPKAVEVTAVPRP